jgi:hypothetical protein
MGKVKKKTVNEQFLGDGKEWQALKSDNLAAIFEPIN